MPGNSLILTQADIYTPQKVVTAGAIVIEGGKIYFYADKLPPDKKCSADLLGLPQRRAGLKPCATLAESLNLKGCILVPGFIDLHNHGAMGIDFNATPPQDWLPVLKYMTSQGTTAYLATLISSPHEHTIKSLTAIANYCSRNASPFAECLGIHLEGPYLNPQQKGIHNEKFLRLPNIPEIEEYITAGRNYLKMLTFAPELDSSIIPYLVEQHIIPAAGHSTAGYDTSCRAISAGLKYAVHTCNAMPVRHHREPGILGAVLEDDRVCCELIADGIHLHPALLKLVYKIKGARKLVLSTDSIPPAGLPPGQYCLQDQTIVNDSSRLSNPAGKLAGSSLTLVTAVKNMLKWSGCTLSEALTMASFNPARILGLANKGEIAEGKDADLIVFYPDLTIRMVIKGGNIVWP
ncbi:MAG: N-acetylglucosamine-6-phosphate deacetylase [Candidatus Schekmanbacteria bacterium]|nr:N-acetylglucosamine-6-phosphate deacetylase [Candidatus Schekmanbacteria bacterium]